MQKIYKYQIQHLEGSEWLPKCNLDFEDKGQFNTIAKCIGYRILEDGKDVTKRYFSGYTPLSKEPIKVVAHDILEDIIPARPRVQSDDRAFEDAQTEIVEPIEPSTKNDIAATSTVGIPKTDKPMKPSQYEKLSIEQKLYLKRQIADMLSQKIKRTAIVQALNVSEYTYDVIRHDNFEVNSDNKDDNPIPIVAESTDTDVDEILNSWG